MNCQDSDDFSCYMSQKDKESSKVKTFRNEKRNRWSQT